MNGQGVFVPLYELCLLDVCLRCRYNMRQMRSVTRQMNASNSEESITRVFFPGLVAVIHILCLSEVSPCILYSSVNLCRTVGITAINPGRTWLTRLRVALRHTVVNLAWETADSREFQEEFGCRASLDMSKGLSL